MAFKKGQGKPEDSGIKKGQKQRSTQMVNFLFDFFEDKLRPDGGDLIDAWDRLNEREQWDVFIKCLKHMCLQVETEDDGKVSGFGQLIRNLAKR